MKSLSDKRHFILAQNKTEDHYLKKALGNQQKKFTGTFLKWCQISIKGKGYVSNNIYIHSVLKEWFVSETEKWKIYKLQKR